MAVGAPNLRRTRTVRYPLRMNRAGPDEEPRLSILVGRKMTFSYAVIAEGGIVLAADSQVTHTHRTEYGDVIGTYVNQRGKIKRLRDRAAFSIAGNAGFADTLLAKARFKGIDPDQSFEELVKDYAKVFRAEVDDKHEGLPNQLQVAFLYCGYIRDGAQHVPQIVKLDSSNYFAYNSVTGRGYAWSGATEHGAAIYLHNRFYREELTLEQAKLLAYCIAAEVAQQDNSVGGPIEVEVITPTGTSALTGIEKYEQGRQEIANQIDSFLRNWVVG